MPSTGNIVLIVIVITFIAVIIAMTMIQIVRALNYARDLNIQRQRDKNVDASAMPTKSGQASDKSEAFDVNLATLFWIRAAHAITNAVISVEGGTQPQLFVKILGTWEGMVPNKEAALRNSIAGVVDSLENGQSMDAVIAPAYSNAFLNEPINRNYFDGLHNKYDNTKQKGAYKDAFVNVLGQFYAIKSGGGFKN